MQELNGLNLRPLFYSEISSSFLICEIFRNHTEIAKAFIKAIFNIEVDKLESIDREKNYKGKGFIDVIIQCQSNGRKIHILIEVKVHDYISATQGQIRTYFDAAADELSDGDIYFIYLTQFNANNLPTDKGAAIPGTIKEFEHTRKRLGINEDKLKHVNWVEFHSFMSQFKGLLNQEEQLMLELQEKWIKAESEYDLDVNTVEVGDRGLSDYFDDVKIDLCETIPFGKVSHKNKRTVYEIDITQCTYPELNLVLDTIKKFASSKRIEKKSLRITEDATLSAAKDFLSSLAQNTCNWRILAFYSILFDYVHTTNYLQLFGTGMRGFSIRVWVKQKGNISLCTLWANGVVEFSLKR